MGGSSRGSAAGEAESKPLLGSVHQPPLCLLIGLEKFNVSPIGKGSTYNVLNADCLL